MASNNDIQLRIDTLTNAVDTAKTVGELKKAYKALTSAAVEFQDTNSDAFNQVTAAAGRVKDKLGDVNDSINSLNGDQIQNLGASLDLTSNSLKNLDFGAATQGLKNLGSTIKGFNFGSIKEGIQGVSSAFKELGATLLANPILLVAAIIVAIGVALYELKDIIPGVGAAFAAIGDAINAVIKVITDFTDAIGLTAVASTKKANQVIKDNDRESAAIQARYDKEIALAKDANKSVVELEYAKLEANSKQAQAQIDAYNTLKKNQGKLTDEQKVEYNKSLDAFKAAEDAKVIYVADTSKKILDLQKDLNAEIAKGRINLMADGAAKTAATIDQARFESDQKLAIERKTQLDEARIAGEDAARKAQQGENDIFGLKKSQVNEYAIKMEGLKAQGKLQSEFDEKDRLDKKNDSKQKSKAYLDQQVALQSTELSNLQRQADNIKNIQGITDEDRKAKLLANLEEQKVAYDDYYKKEVAAAQGNKVALNQLADQKAAKEKEFKDNATKLNDDYWAKQNETAKNAQTRELDEADRLEQAKRDIKIKYLQDAIDADQLELDKLVNRNSIKFGLEKDLLDKIHQAKVDQANVDNATELQALNQKHDSGAITEAEYQDKIKQLNASTSQKIKELDEQTAQAKKEINLRTIETISGYAQAGMEAASGLADIADQSENQRLKKGEKASLEVQKKQFNRRKALGIVNAIISTAEGIAKSVAESPETGGLPGSAIAALVGGIQIAKISSSKFQGDSGGGESGGSVATPTVPSQAASQTLANAGRPSPFLSNTDLSFGSNAPISNKSGGGVDRVVVLDYNDVRSAAQRAQVRDTRTSL